jgi:hypothetical protein
MNNIYIALLDTRNFTFKAIGTDERSARQSLIDGLEVHRIQYELNIDWYDYAEISIECMEIGVAYRDYSKLIKERE